MKLAQNQKKKKKKKTIMTLIYLPFLWYKERKDIKKLGICRATPQARK